MIWCHWPSLSSKDLYNCAPDALPQITKSYPQLGKRLTTATSLNAYLIKNTFKSALITMLQIHYTMFKKCFNFAILIAVLTRYSGYFLSCVLFFSTHERVFVIPFIAWVKCGTGVKRCKHILFRLNSKSSETVTSENTHVLPAHKKSLTPLR